MTEVVSHVVILMAKKLQGLEECWRVLFCFPPPSDSPSSTDGCVARGRSSNARHVFGETPDEEATHRSCRIARGCGYCR
jgi:hypothetical protein